MHITLIFNSRGGNLDPFTYTLINLGNVLCVSRIKRVKLKQYLKGNVTNELNWLKFTKEYF